MSWSPPPSRRPPREPKPIPDLLTEHDLELLAGGAGRADEDSVRDLPALREIVAQAAKFVEAEPAAAVPDIAAIYVIGLLVARPFTEGRNFLTAIAALRFFGRLNGWEDGFADDEWAPFLADVARGDLGAADVARLIASFMRPR